MQFISLPYIYKDYVASYTDCKSQGSGQTDTEKWVADKSERNSDVGV